MKFRFLLFTFYFLLFSASAQDSSRIRISLLTCTPGDELYSLFGHSALRVIDSNSVTDHVYNYGTFNFDDPSFYLNFTRGKLLYYVSLEYFEDFKNLYQYTRREITEQVLQLSAEEEKNIQQFLINNLKEENRYYKYDFFFDNCTTRLRDIINKFKTPTPLLPAVKPANMRFRQAIHEYLNKGGQQWSKFGIDILLGARTDRMMTAAEQQFLPDNLMMAIDSNRNGRLVSSSKKLYSLDATTKPTNFFTPFVIFTLLFILFAFLHFSKKFPLLLAGLDGLLFFLTGLLGFILIFMWTATDHSMTKDNYNLLWALPTHLFASFFILSKKQFIKKYFLFTALAALLLLMAWYFLPQQLNTALLPLQLLLMFRAWARSNV
ncbi:MAG TPA: DUF4105 domain-containing protein [Ferruginibacter sp.]|nr:DUF4105 domain-containing protein [Ferruginibacter sp.]HRE64896.1 DUF4105 domain-containing protein [Ferruginibacter sp.]